MTTAGKATKPGYICYRDEFFLKGVEFLAVEVLEDGSASQMRVEIQYLCQPLGLGDEFKALSLDRNSGLKLLSSLVAI